MHLLHSSTGMCENVFILLYSQAWFCQIDLKLEYKNGLGQKFGAGFRPTRQYGYLTWHCCVMHWLHTSGKQVQYIFVVLCFVVVMQSFIMNSHEAFIHIHQGCFAGTGAIFRLPQCQWSKPDGYGKISQCITTTKHSKAKTVCIFLGIYCTL